MSTRQESRDNEVAALGGILFAVCFLGCGGLGGSIDPNLGALIGLFVGAVLGVIGVFVIDAIFPDPAHPKPERLPLIDREDQPDEDDDPA